jgi:Ribbon-helix-helix protein, copG family
MGRTAVSVYLSFDVDKRLKARAESLGVSQSALINDLIERELRPGRETAVDVTIKLLARLTATSEALLETQAAGLEPDSKLRLMKTVSDTQLKYEHNALARVRKT